MDCSRVGESLFSGKEQWNGMVEWNSGMTMPTYHSSVMTHTHFIYSTAVDSVN